MTFVEQVRTSGAVNFHSTLSRFNEYAVDKRVLRVYSFSLLSVVIAAFALVPFADCDATSKLLLIIWTGLAGFATTRVVRTKFASYGGRSLSVVCLYFLLAYPSKAIASRLRFRSTQGYLMSEALFDDALLPAIAYTFGAFLAIAVVLGASAVSAPRLTQGQAIQPLRFNRFAWLMVVALVVKYLSLYHLIWGVPNTPTQNEIPQVTGATVMFCRIGIYHFVNVGIAYASTGLATSKQRLLLAILVLLFVLLDLGVGSKYSVIYVLLSMFLTIPIAKGTNRASTKKVRLLMTLACIGIFVYPFVHSFRFARKASPNDEIADLVNKAVQTTLEKSQNNLLLDAFIQVSERINGFQNHAAAIYYEAAIKASLADLLSAQDVSQRYTTAVTGIRHESNTFGVTQSGMLAVLCEQEIGPIAVLSFVLNLGSILAVLRSTEYLSSGYALNSSAASVSAGVFLVFLQFHGGNFVFIAKQLAIVLLAIYVADRLLFDRRVRHKAV